MDSTSGLICSASSASLFALRYCWLYHLAFLIKRSELMEIINAGRHAVVARLRLRMQTNKGFAFVRDDDVGIDQRHEDWTLRIFDGHDDFSMVLMGFAVLP